MTVLALLFAEILMVFPLGQSLMGVRVESRELPNSSRLRRAGSPASPEPCWSLLGVSGCAGSLSLIPAPPWSLQGADGAAHSPVLLPELMSSTWCLPRPDLKVSLSLGKSGVWD